MGRGFALALGGQDDSSSLLLALLYESSGHTTSLWPIVGIDPVQLAARLAEEGLEMPRAPLPLPPAQAAQASVHFPASDLKGVLNAMIRSYPPGSGLRWGWNRAGDRCVLAIYDATELPNVLAIARSVAITPDAVTVGEHD